MTAPTAEQPRSAVAGTDSLTWALEKAARWLNALADEGPDLRVNAHHKAVHEARELAADPTPIEAADVLICIVGTALQQGWTFADLAHAVNHKVRINSARTWSQQPDGTWQHDLVTLPGSEATS